MIYENQGDLEQSIKYRQDFLDLCIENKNTSATGQAHKQLAETHSKGGNISQAIKHLLEVLNIALESSDKQAQAEAALKLGLLYNKEGERKNIKKSAEFLNSHFDLLRQGDKEKKGKQGQIDAARVNLGIVLANQKIEAYKHLVLNDLQGLVSWKVHRD